MAKTKNKFVCQSCGAVYQKWSGKCDACGEWDCIVEEVADANFSKINTKSKGNVLGFSELSGVTEQQPRINTAITELDRVLGGGLVPGCAILLGGDPGIGKSTLMLQMMANLAAQDRQIVYISGEESLDQIRLRADRLGLKDHNIRLLTATNVNDIIVSLKTIKDLDFVVIDSIQTMFVEEVTSAPGTVSQVRAASHELINFAKSHNISLLLVGHVTKEGQIAGPKVLEHMVDTVLYFEGEKGHQFRIIRAVKNRFGPANEIGIFEMQERGLTEVLNPSSLFLSDGKANFAGSVVYAGIEGTRPVLIEIQALVAPSYMATPRRAVVGWDSNRLAMILAVLHARYGIFLGDKEVYLNVAGGMRVDEPAADLAVAAALLSAATNTPIDHNTVLFGELGLSGEVRAVSRAQVRLNEAKKLGFEKAIIPRSTKFNNNDFILTKIKHIRDLRELFNQKVTQEEGAY